MVQPADSVARGRLLNFRVNDEEWERLNRLAAHYGVNVSAVLRMLARRDSVALGLEPATPPAPPPPPAPRGRRSARGITGG